MINNYVNAVKHICGKYSAREIWNDFISTSAISLANVFDQEQAPGREQTYLQIAKKYTNEELETFRELLASLVTDLEKDPDRDILGEVCNSLNLNNKDRDQYFTPYNVSKMMAKMTLGTKDMENGPHLIHEPCCGSGSNLIAMANAMKEQGINYQKNAYFAAQDIDPITAKMCYIQMSLLGMPGIVIIGNTLTSPMQGDCWFTPFHFVFGILTLKHYRDKQRQMVSEPISHNNYENDWLLGLVGLA